MFLLQGKDKNHSKVQEETGGKKILRPPDFRIRYKKTLKGTGSPIIVWDTKENAEYACSSFELKNCDVKMYYGNSIKQEKACGATTILEVWRNE